MKRMIIVILVLMLYLSGTASAVTFDDVVGTWHAVIFERDGIPYYSPEFENNMDIELKNDGTGIMYIPDSEKTEFDWGINRGALLIDGVACEFQDDEIRMVSKKSIIHFRKEFPQESKMPTELKVSDPSELYGIWSIVKIYNPASARLIITDKALQKSYGNYSVLVCINKDFVYSYAEVGEDSKNTSKEYTFTEGKITWIADNGNLSECMLTDSGEMIIINDEEKVIFVRCDDQMWFCENCNLFVEGNFCNNCGSKRPDVQ